MKAFVALLTVAMAAAEPQWLMGNPLLHPFTYSGLKTIDMKDLKVKEIKPVEYKLATTPYIASPYMYNWGLPAMYKPYEMPKVETDYAMKGKYVAEAAGGVIHKAKRSAESDPLFYSALPYASTWATPYTNTWAARAAFTPYTTLAHPMVYNTAAWPMTLKTLADDRSKEADYAKKGEYMAVNAGAVHIAKRSAESDPLFYSALPYASTWATPYASTWATPYTTTAAVASPMVYAKPMVYSTPMLINPLKTIANDRMKTTNEYAKKGEYVAVSAGVAHLAKREAESDPALLYSSFAGYPYAMNTLPYTTYASAWNTGYPYTTYASAWNMPYYNRLFL